MLKLKTIWSVAFLLAATALGANGVAQEEHVEKLGQSESQDCKKLLAQCIREHAKYNDDMLQLSNEMEDCDETARAKMEKQFSVLEEGLDSIADNYLMLVDCGDKDLAVSLQAINWIMENCRGERVFTRVRLAILNFHLANDAAAELLMHNSFQETPQPTREFLETVIRTSPSKKVRGLASLALADLLSDARDSLPMIDNDPEIKEYFPDRYRFILSLKDLTEDEVTSRYQMVIDDYGDIKLRSTTLRKQVTLTLEKRERQQQLAVGNAAPEIEGRDMEGDLLKLSDYRGKVVLLEFWGTC